jgi:hypothetical protein
MTILATLLQTGTGLDLNGIWLNDAEDLTDVRAFRYAGNTITVTATLEADIQQLVGRRILTGSDTKVYESFSIDLRMCDADQVQWLRDHIGRLLCIRDPYGAKAYVVYTTAPREIPAGLRHMTSVKVTLDQIDHSEAV